VATTTAIAVPFCTEVPVKTMFLQAERGSAMPSAPSMIATDEVFSTASLSPVRADSITNRSRAVTMRASAGTMSPAERRIMSPGTSSSKGISMRSLSRRAVQVLETRSLRASAALPLRASWINFMPPDTSSMTPMTMTVEGSRWGSGTAMTSI